MRDDGKAIVIITHKLNEVKELSDRVVVLRKGEVVEGNEDALLWFSDDDNRLLVAFMAPLKVGAMNGRLATYEGLAHDFTALLSDKNIK